MVLLGHGHPHAERETGSDGGAHRLENHAAEAHAVVQRSAE